MDSALNNLQRWICYKTQTTNEPCLIIKVLVTLAEFLELSDYCTITTTNVFGFFHGVITQFDLVKHKFTN